MILSHLKNLTVIDEDLTDDSFGSYIDKRSVEQLFNYGLILLDKPPGPTSHETVAWTKRILNLPKIGHSGTLDPAVSGVLPLGLGNATKALGVLLLGPKEYYALGRIHSFLDGKKLDDALSNFRGPIYQKPPQRSSVLRQTRVRTIHELELLEQKERLLLLRVLCESGTYIRKLYYDLGEVLGNGSTMIELRRSRVHQFSESDHLVTLYELTDAYNEWKDNQNDTKLRQIIRPIEQVFSEMKSVIIRDSAVGALCHGAQLAIPGVLQVSKDLKKGDLVAVYTQKNEIVAIAEAQLNPEEIKNMVKGQAFITKRIIMDVDVYPKRWSSKTPRSDLSSSPKV